MITIEAPDEVKRLLNICKEIEEVKASIPKLHSLVDEVCSEYNSNISHDTTAHVTRDFERVSEHLSHAVQMITSEVGNILHATANFDKTQY